MENSQGKSVRFQIAFLTREHLAELGYDTSNISDETMLELAQDLADDYYDNMFEASIRALAEVKYESELKEVTNVIP